MSSKKAKKSHDEDMVPTTKKEDNQSGFNRKVAICKKKDMSGLRPRTDVYRGNCFSVTSASGAHIMERCNVPLAGTFPSGLVKLISGDQVSERKLSSSPISASDTNFNPQNVQHIPAVKIWILLDLDKKP